MVKFLDWYDNRVKTDENIINFNNLGAHYPNVMQHMHNLTPMEQAKVRNFVNHRRPSSHELMAFVQGIYRQRNMGMDRAAMNYR